MKIYSYEQVGHLVGMSGNTLRRHVLKGGCPAPDLKQLSRSLFSEGQVEAVQTYFDGREPWDPIEGTRHNRIDSHS